jgi:hypothetical protein
VSLLGYLESGLIGSFEDGLSLETDFTIRLSYLDIDLWFLAITSLVGYEKLEIGETTTAILFNVFIL